MASVSTASGELYFVAEHDPKTRQDSEFVKIGIVRESEKRSSDYRVKEHQTGNPRQLHLLKVFSTPVVEQVETLLHGIYAPQRLSGEWFHFSAEQRVRAIDTAERFVGEAQDSLANLLAIEDLKSVESNGVNVIPSDDVKAAFQRLLYIRGQLSVVDKIVRSIDNAIRKSSDEGISVVNFADLNEGVETQRFLETDLQKDHPEIWATFASTTAKLSQRFLLTEPKALKNEIVDSLSDLRSQQEDIESLIDSVKSEGELAELHTKFLELLTIQAPLEWDEKILTNMIKASCGEAGGIDGVCTWSRHMEDKPTFDKKAFGEAHPELLAKYSTITVSKPKLRIYRDRNFIIS